MSPPSADGGAALLPTRSLPWFDDGSIVLEAESVQFRVYRGILSANSSIFKDMFTLSQPGSEGDVEGCPVVHLTDSAQDLRFVLEIIHDTNKSYFAAKEKIPLGVVAACLRLGAKYEFGHLKAEALRRLHNDFPSTFNQINCLYDEKAQLIEHYSGISADIVTLAREHNVSSILPAALYHGSTYSFDEILYGKQRPDGTLSTLSVEDQKICILAKEKLIQLQAVEASKWLRVSYDGEISPDGLGLGYNVCGGNKCVLQRRAAFRKFWCPTPMCLALVPYKQLRAKGMCAVCDTSCALNYDGSRARVWKKLPSIFGMPPWNELLKD